MPPQYQLPPPPTDLPQPRWFQLLYARILAANIGAIAWLGIDFSMSNLTSVVTRNHNDLQAIQGGAVGDYQHLTTAQAGLLRGPAYGGFFSALTQQVTAANTPTALTFDSTEYAVDVTLGTPTSRVVVGTTGIYELTFNMELAKANASTSYVDIWLRKNGADIPNSGYAITVNGNNVRQGIGRSFLEELVAGDYLELVISSSDAGMTVLYTAAQTSPTRPAASSVNLMLKRVD